MRAYKFVFAWAGLVLVFLTFCLSQNLRDRAISLRFSAYLTSFTQVRRTKAAVVETTTYHDGMTRSPESED